MKEKEKNAAIVSLNDNVSEIKELASSLNYKVICDFIQHRNNPDVNSYIGPGKIDEIKKYIEESEKNIDLLVVDGDLKPSQWFNLEKKLGVTVFDRIRLILEIFDNRAERKEARLQVKLASLEYERPYVREIIHRARSGEHPGFMAGGEYQVDDYYEMIKKQTKKIKSDLEKIRKERSLRRQHRHKGGFFLVSLVGYTNAGKSSLLNLLSGEKVKVEGRLFSTLSTTTRKIKNNKIPVLLTDTVGFIQDLPAMIVDAFHSTLEEIEVADVVLLLVDISEDISIVERKLCVSLDELVDLGVNANIVVVYNKIDMISDKELLEKIDFLEKRVIKNEKEVVCISVKNQVNTDKLIDVIYGSFPRFAKFRIILPINKETQSFISWIYEKANVVDISYADNVSIFIESDTGIRDKIISKCVDLDGQFLG